MAGDNLTEEDIFNNDVDPLEGIRQLRKAESGEAPPELEEEIEANVDDNLPPADPVDEIEDDLPPAPDAGEEDDPAPLPEIKNEEGEDPGEAEPDTKKPAEAVLDLAQKRQFKANGQEFEFTVEEILEQFGTVFAQSMDYTKKTQKIAPYRKMISALEEENITAEQLNVAIDALKGNKGAIKQLMDTHNIESYDLSEPDDNSPYNPTQYGADEATLNLKEVVNSIASDPEYSTTVDVVQNQWDVNSQNKLAGSPELLQGLHNDVKSGVYATVAPEAMKLKILDGNRKSDIEYYMLAGQQISQKRNAAPNVDDLNKQTQDAVANSGRASSEANRKRSASSTGNRSDRTVIDYLDDDDEAFDDWYKKVTSSQ